MARPYLTGFIQRPKAGGTSSAQALDLIRKSHLSQTQGGEFANVAEIDSYIEKLKKMNQSDPKVQEEILDMENKKLQFQANQQDLISTKGVYETILQKAVSNAIKNNFNNPKDVLASLAAIYGDASANYSEQVLSKVFDKYGTTKEVPAEMLNFSKELEAKGKTYADLFNSYNFQDPQTGEIGALDPNGFAVLIDSNPATGKVISMDFVPTDKLPDGYLRADVPLNMGEGAKKLPTYLKSYDVGVTEAGTKIKGARLGNFEFAGTTEAKKKEDDKRIGNGILKAQKPEESVWKSLARVFLPVSLEYKWLGRSVERDYDTFKKSGVNPANGFEFDSTDLPGNSLVQVGSKTYYQDDNGGLMELAGSGDEAKQNLDTYLSGLGKQPVGRFFADKNYLVDPQGASKVKGMIDKNVFSPEMSKTSAPISFAPPAPDTRMVSKTSFFANQVNRPTTPPPPRETVKGKGIIGEIIDKGKSFFRDKFSNMA